MGNLSKRFNFLRKFLACEIPFPLMFRRDVRFPHAVGIVISAAAKIGRDVTVFQNVTIGGKDAGLRAGFPEIGDRVTIYAGAVVVGRVVVGAGAVIGAGAVVVADVPPGAIVAGNPARPVNSRR